MPFYTHFLNCWSEARHPEYDFDNDELIYRDGAGNETARAPLGVAVKPALAEAALH